jgi:hypothetical protein
VNFNVKFNVLLSKPIVGENKKDFDEFGKFSLNSFLQSCNSALIFRRLPQRSALKHLYSKHMQMKSDVIHRWSTCEKCCNITSVYRLT